MPKTKFRFYLEVYDYLGINKKEKKMSSIKKIAISQQYESTWECIPLMENEEVDTSDGNRTVPSREVPGPKSREGPGTGRDRTGPRDLEGPVVLWSRD